MRVLASSFKSLQCSGATDARSSAAWAYETATALAANSRATLFMLISSFFTEASGSWNVPFLSGRTTVTEAVELDRYSAPQKHFGNRYFTFVPGGEHHRLERLRQQNDRVREG